MSDFLAKVSAVKEFTSTSGKRYAVVQVFDDVMMFRRVDADNTIWDMDLRDVYKAYIELDTYTTERFADYVPRRHSPARGLLLYLKLIAEEEEV